jgi:hypothetical protein
MYLWVVKYASRRSRIRDFSGAIHRSKAPGPGASWLLTRVQGEGVRQGAFGLLQCAKCGLGRKHRPSARPRFPVFMGPCPPWLETGVQYEQLAGVTIHG